MQFEPAIDWLEAREHLAVIDRIEHRAKSPFRYGAP